MKNKRSWLAAPYVVWMALFTVIPIIMMVVYAFTSAGGGFTLNNFTQMGTYAVVFFRSFKLAVIATAENLNTMKLQEKARKAQEAAEKAEAEATAKKLKDMTVKIAAKAGEGGRLFGAVTATEVSAALAQQHGVNIAKTKLVLDEPIKACGGYQIKAKLGYEVVGTVSVMVTEA